MTRTLKSLLWLMVGFNFTIPCIAADTKSKSTTTQEEVAVQPTQQVAKLEEMMGQEAPVSFQKSNYDEHMINVNWMNRNGYVVGAPAWKGGEDGLHCH